MFGVSILLGNGDGTFQPPVQIQSFASLVLLAAGDFNGDGRLDFVAGGASAFKIKTPLTSLK